MVARMPGRKQTEDLGLKKAAVKTLPTRAKNEMTDARPQEHRSL
jgi:hypothetical protein